MVRTTGGWPGQANGNLYFWHTWLILAAKHTAAYKLLDSTCHYEHAQSTKQVQTIEHDRELLHYSR